MMRPRRLAPRAPMIVRRKPAIAISRRSWKAVRLIWRQARKKGPRSAAPSARPVGNSSLANHFAIHFNLATSFASHLRIGGSPPSLQAIVWSAIQPAPTLLRSLLHRTLERVSGILVLRRYWEAVSRSRFIREASSTELRRRLKSSEVRSALHSVCVDRRLVRTPWQAPVAPAALGSGMRPQSIGRVWRRFQKKMIEPSFASMAALPKRASSLLELPVRPPEFVWRTAAETAEPGRTELARATPYSPAPSSASFSFAHSETPAAVISAEARLLDPALIDRVAEDVIGRVERRIRIERERRGV